MSNERHPEPIDWPLVAVYAGLVAAALWVYLELTGALWASGEPQRIHAAVIAGTADYPHQYRFLTPWLAELMTRLGVPLRAAYLLIRGGCDLASILLLQGLMTRWLRRDLAFAGCLIVIALLPFATIASGFQPTDPGNLLAFVVACRLLVAGQDRWLFGLVVLAMMNRETIGLVVLLAAAVRWDERRDPGYWRLVVGLAVTAAAMLLAIRLGYGPREPFTELVTPLHNIPANLTRPGSLRLLVLYGWLWVLALGGADGQPQFLWRGLVALLPVFLAVHLSVGLLGETRYFLPLAPLLLPLALRRLFPEGAR